MRAALRGKTVTLDSPLGALTLGVVDPDHPGVAEGISRLLFRSIEDARATVGGHLPDWLVEDIKRNYIAPERIRSLWAPFGHRFAVVLDGAIVATVHVTRAHDTIFTIDRHTVNVSSRSHPGFKPEGFHHVVNLSVRHELRRARIATAMFDGIATHFRDLFDGVGLWVRADPPWHAGLAGLGFEHDPSRDLFLPGSAERTAGLPHAELNARYACDCPGADAEGRARAMREQKLQYVSFTRAFAAHRAPSVVPRTRASDAVVDERYASDWGGRRRLVPRAVTHPTSVAELAEALARASAERTPVAIRGRGYSGAGQALTRGLVVSTSRLDRILDVRADEVTVQGGVTWEALVTRGLFPPVITGWAPATIGGTLAAGGYSKGSHRRGLAIDHVRRLVVVTGDGRVVACSGSQAGWLFGAVLGGMGAFGVIAEATLTLDPDVPRFVRVERERVRDLAAALDDPSAYHVTSYGDRDGFTVVRAVASDAGVPIATYAAPARPTAPPGPSIFVHAYLPRAGLDAYLAGLALDHAGGDAIQVIAIRNQDPERPSLLQLPAGETVYAVSIAREVRDRDGAALEREARETLDRAERLGGKVYLAGEPPRALDAHAGAHWDAIVRAKRLADPAQIMGAVFTAP